MSATLRRIAPRIALAIVLAALGASVPLAGTGDASADARHDYLTLVLSWSPTYCASPAGRSDTVQCAAGRRYAFVVHGLWPQFERGWPEYCDDGRAVPDETVEAMRDIMPSRRLIRHEWRKHGTCSGLGPHGYFVATRALFDRIRIPARYIAPQAPVITAPAALIDDFLKSNLWLERDMISAHCGNRRDSGRLTDLRFCFTREFEPRACGANERRACRAARLVLPPVR